MSKSILARLSTIWTAIWDIITVTYSLHELFAVLASLAYSWSVLRLIAFFSGIPMKGTLSHIPKLVSLSVLFAVWLAILFIVPIVMRRKRRK